MNTLVADSQGATVSIPQLDELHAEVVTATAQLKRLQRPSSGLIGSLGDARTKFNQADATLTNELSRGQQILGYALPFLGANGPRTYLLATENNSEMRDQGAILSVGTLQTQDGKITVVNPQSVGDLPLSSPVNYAVPRERSRSSAATSQRNYGSPPTRRPTSRGAGGPSGHVWGGGRAARRWRPCP